MNRFIKTICVSLLLLMSHIAFPQDTIVETRPKVGLVLSEGTIQLVNIPFSVKIDENFQSNSFRNSLPEGIVSGDNIINLFNSPLCVRDWSGILCEP